MGNGCLSGILDVSGSLEIGDDPLNQSILRVNSGSSLILRKNSLLKIGPNSQLIIEKGAEFIIEQGAQIRSILLSDFDNLLYSFSKTQFSSSLATSKTSKVP